MSWRHTFEVAGFIIGIESECADTTPILQDLTNLYPAANGAPGLLFRIARENERIALTANDELLWQGIDAGEIAAGFEVHLYRRIVAAITPEQCSIHAASLAINDSATIFAGDSGAGKSTICTKGVLSGCTYLSDEFALINPDGKILPFPRPLQWGKTRHPAFTHRQMLESGLVSKSGFSFPAHTGGTVHNLFWLPRRVGRKPYPLRHIVLHAFDKRVKKNEILPIRRSEALMELPRHLHLQQRPDLMLKTLNRRIPTHVTFFRFRYADIHEAWPQLMKRLND